MTLEHELSGKRVLLVGATGVLGSAYSKALSESNCSLCIADRPGSRVLSLGKTLGCSAVEMDVTIEESVRSGVSQAIESLEGLDAVVNNAAATSEGLRDSANIFESFENYPLDLWKYALDVNLTGSFLVARESAEELKKSKGVLINVSSIYGLVGPDHRMYENQSFASFPAYSASKSGILGFTRWLATWWGKDGVRVNCITPGGIFNDHNEAFQTAYANKTPLGRMGNSDDLIGILFFLISDRSSYCTGQNFIVDGGFTAW